MIEIKYSGDALDETWPERYMPELRARLQQLLNDPNGQAGSQVYKRLAASRIHLK